VFYAAYIISGVPKGHHITFSNYIAVSLKIRVMASDCITYIVSLSMLQYLAPL